MKLQDNENFCTLEETAKMVMGACKYPSFRYAYDNLCHLSLFYKNDKQRLETNEISERVFRSTELNFKQYITEGVCNERFMPNFVNALNQFTNKECDISSKSCPRFQMQYLIDHDKYRGTVFSKELL